MATFSKTKLNIYESHNLGFITESEKNELLDILEKAVPEDTSSNKPFSGPLKDAEVDSKTLKLLNEDNKLKASVYANYHVAKKEIFALIDKIFDNWYDDEEKKKTGIKSKGDCKRLATTLIDTITISHSNKGTYTIGYWVSNTHKDPNSNKFFADHSMDAYVTICDKSYKLMETDKAQLNG